MMGRWVRSVLAMSAGVFALLPAGATADTARRPAPAFVLESRDGELDLHSFAGKPLVLNVFASWCPPCRQELPGIVRAASVNRGRIAFVGVDELEPHTMGDRFARQMHIPYTVVYDQGQFAASYDASALPTTIFIDARGRLVAVHHGALTAAALEAYLRRLRAG